MLASPLLNEDGSPRTNEAGETVFVDDAMVQRTLAHMGASQKAAEQRRRQLSKEEIHILRVRAKRDLFFLCSSILGNNRLTTSFHGHLTEDIRRTQEEYAFRLYLLPRGCFKTTIITIGHTLQEALPYTKEDAAHDDDSTPLSWPSNLGPDVRSLIAHETRESAARFLYAITNHVTNNALLMALFPEIVPSPRTHIINKWELELPRTITGNPEPTFDTLGVGGKSQGRHYNRIKLDDIFGDKARDSEAEAATTKQWFDNIQSFFSDFGKDKLDIIGTRYSFDDVYAHAIEQYEGQLHTYVRKIEERGKDGKLHITFSEGFPAHRLEIIKKNKKVYDAQYLNDPSEGSLGFDPEWRRYFHWIDPLKLRPVSSDGKVVPLESPTNVRDLDVCFLIDPGQEKTGGFVVTGMDYRKRVFVLSSIKLELKPPDLTRLVFLQALKWRPRTVGIEADFFMNVFKPYWETMMQLKSQYFHITECFTKKQKKEDRINGLANWFSDGRILLNEAQEDLLEEYRVFGKSKKIHILDALAYGPEIWRPGYPPGMREERNNPVEQVDDRDIETGYSAIN